MSSFKLFKTLKSIVHIVKNYPNLSKENILDRLENDYDFNISTRTLERHFKTLKDEFGVDIAYSYSGRGYVISEDNDQEHLSEFLKFAEFLSIAEFYTEPLNDFKAFKNFMIPEDNSNFEGLEHITTIFTALKDNCYLSFNKKNFYNDNSKNYEIIPLRLKEYKNRWYLVAGLKGELELRNFGLDRIDQLKIGDQHQQNLTPYNELIESYNTIVGLNYSNHKLPLKVVLKVSKNQVHYLRSLPLHHSQVIGPDFNDNWVKVTYYLKPNYELEIELLKMAANVIVIEPEVLKNSIKTHLQNMISNY
ncbi:helix-turn-helix transcriptional regulator [Lacinutrix undariae]